jgi:hypothetical protein
MSERRKFLQGLAAVSAGLVLNVEGRTVASSSQCPDLWPEFVKSKKEKYPCALVIEFSFLYHEQFLKLADSKSRAVQALFSKVPGIVLDKAQLTRHLKINNPANNIFLVSMDGKVLKKGKLDFSKLANSRELTKSLEEFYYSDKVLSKSWQEFSKSVQKEDAELKKYLDTLDKGNYRERSAARKEINKNIRKNIWGVYQCARTSESIEQRESCRDLLISYKSHKSTPVIQGVPAIRSRNSDIRILCGMASMPLNSRLFIGQVVKSA